MYKQDRLCPDRYWGSCEEELRSLLDTLKGSWKIEAHPKDSYRIPMVETTHFFSEYLSEIGYLGKAYSPDPDVKFTLLIFPGNRQWDERIFDQLDIIRGEKYIPESRY